jgi:hypothetical protein
MLLVLDTTERDDAGYLMTPAHYFSTPAYAIVSDTADIAIDGPDEVAAQFLGTVRIRSESDRPVFVGIARAQDVDAYLEGVRRAVVTQIGADGDYTTGHSPPSTPAPAQQFWAASTVGAGEQFLTWEPEDGNWKVVVMNADASPSVAADLSIGAELDPIVWVGLGIGLAGLLLLVGGAFGIYAAIPKGEEQ